jgi:peptidoglycan/LPS O-acetylase OafA/YrhL
MSTIFESSLARSAQYRPDIDGLRALAVLPVVLFHAKVPGFSGGFVGVDIFFVISGYLITSLIIKDIRERKFSFGSFYERRIRRIFPALFAVTLSSTLAAAVLLAPTDFAAFGKSVLAVTFFASNLYFARQTTGYFDSNFNVRPLLHTWSLSVEEQFYLLLPAVLILLHRSRRDRIVTGLAAVSVVSFVLSVWLTQHSPAVAFYSLASRAWELLLGALIAVRAIPALTNRPVREVTGVLGLALLAWAVVGFTDQTPFPGASALFPCLGAGLIIHAGQDGPSHVKTALSWRALVIVGAASYSLYLWHWPLIAFSTYFSAGDLDPSRDLGKVAVILVCSLVLALLSLELIEKPFRRGGAWGMTRRQVFAFAGATSVVVAAAGLAIVVSRGVPQRYSAAVGQLVAQNEERRLETNEGCGNWKKDVPDFHFCTLGPETAGKIMFWGDSHVGQLYPLIARLSSAGKLQPYAALLALSEGCLPAEHLNSMIAGYHCDSVTTYTMQRAQKPDIRVVYMGFNTWWSVHEFLCQSVAGKCVREISTQEATARFLSELAERIRRLRQAGKHVILSLPFPMYDKSIPELEIRNAVLGRFGLNGVPTDFTSPALREQLLVIARATGADIFDPRRSLCPGGRCITEANGVSIYVDYHHLATSQVGILEENFWQTLRSAYDPRDLARESTTSVATTASR